MASIIVEVANEQQSKNIRNVRETMGSKCGSRAHVVFNSKKGLIYIQNNDLASFQAGLQRVYPIIDVQRANWIKPRKPTSIPILVYFAVEELPEYLRITGKFVLTRVYSYNEKPMQCRNCQMYGHNKKVLERTCYLRPMRGAA